MNTLILMRHAKSSWKQGLVDRDRPLNGRGRMAARHLGAWLRDTGITPDQALVSDAERTQETFQRLGTGLEPELHASLYLAAPEQMLEVLRGATGACVLMIGHNPGIADLAERLVKLPPEHDGFLRYPTGATLVVSFDVEGWAGIQPGMGQVREFVVPRELS